MSEFDKDLRWFGEMEAVADRRALYHRSTNMTIGTPAANLELSDVVYRTEADGSRTILRARITGANLR